MDASFVIEGGQGATDGWVDIQRENEVMKRNSTELKDDGDGDRGEEEEDEYVGGD